MAFVAGIIVIIIIQVVIVIINSFTSFIRIDSAFSQTLSSVLNTNLNPSQITQVSLPVKFGGFGIVSSVHIASSAFLSSLHAADPTCRLISPKWNLLYITTYQTSLTQWKSQCPAPRPT